MSTTRNLFAIAGLAIVYGVCALLYAPYNWMFLAVAPTFVAVVGFYLTTGAVLARSIICALAPLVSLPILVLFLPPRLIIGYAVIHSVLIGGFLGLLWGSVDRRLRPKR